VAFPKPSGARLSIKIGSLRVCAIGVFLARYFRSGEPPLFAFARRFAAPRVVHRLAMEFRAAPSRSFSACRQRSVITLANVEFVIDVTVETIGPVIPGSCTEEYAA
jgi:hypothetical protein